MRPGSHSTGQKSSVSLIGRHRQRRRGRSRRRTPRRSASAGPRATPRPSCSLWSAPPAIARSSAASDLRWSSKQSSRCKYVHMHYTTRHDSRQAFPDSDALRPHGSAHGAARLHLLPVAQADAAGDRRVQPGARAQPGCASPSIRCCRICAARAQFRSRSWLRRWTWIAPPLRATSSRWSMRAGSRCGPARSMRACAW